MQLFFLCPFSKAAWYCFPWFIKSEFLAQHNGTIPHMIQGLLSSQHPHMSLTSLYTFLWCLWKARNDALFGRKFCNPSQIFPVANAIMQGAKFENMESSEDHRSNCFAVQQLATQQDPSSVAGTAILCDAAWKIERDMDSAPAGIGIIIRTDINQHFKQLHVSALSPPAASPLQAETFGLLLATMLAEKLGIQEPTFFTDSAIWLQRRQLDPSSTLQVIGSSDHFLQLFNSPQFTLQPE